MDDNHSVSQQMKDTQAAHNSHQSIPTRLPPLKYIPLPQILLQHEYNLADQGWTTITYEDNDTVPDPLFHTSQALFEACKSFFSQPPSYKKTFKSDERGSEAGFVSIPGEKEFLTLRDLQSTPQELRDPATAFWAQAGKLLNELLGCVSESLGLPGQTLTAFSEPCTAMRENETATLLRLFRYEGDGDEKEGIVAEAHRDLGLLSLVIGDKPGLEVWDRYSASWFSIERTYFVPAASLLVGRQLSWLSNGRYASGQHRVRSYNRSFRIGSTPSTTSQLCANPPSENYRYSIVFVLRAHSPVPIDTDDLTTSITGPFPRSIKGKTARDLFRHIHRTAFNINAPVQEREEQRRKMASKKGGELVQSIGLG
ncbi:hypothetical protein B7463_g1561, partial [Scytalidium lignicola]